MVQTAFFKDRNRVFVSEIGEISIYDETNGQQTKVDTIYPKYFDFSFAVAKNGETLISCPNLFKYCQFYTYQEEYQFPLTIVEMGFIFMGLIIGNYDDIQLE